jgi:hypothetical protein
MFSRLLRADDADEVLGAPRVNDAIHLEFDAAEADEPDLAVVLSIVDPLEHLVFEDRRGGQKRHAVLEEIARRLRLIPFELKLGLDHINPTKIYTIVYISSI